MKIEIEIPELDENEWEYLGICRAKEGDAIYENRIIKKWVLKDFSQTEYHCFRKKQNWKDKIVFPSFLLEGNWIARDEDEFIWIFLSEPEKSTIENCWGFEEECSPLDLRFHDLSFLPKEFWGCNWEDSLVQVRHEVKR
jgi:hypothetical protein